MHAGELVLESVDVADSCSVLAVIHALRRSPAADADAAPDSVLVQLVVDPLVLGIPHTALGLPVLLIPAVALAVAVCVPALRWQFGAWTAPVREQQQHQQ